MLERVALIFGISYRKLEWADSMRRLARLNLPVVRLVNALHARYRLVLLTNVSKSRYMENVDMGFFRKVKMRQGLRLLLPEGWRSPGRRYTATCSRRRGWRPRTRFSLITCS